MMYIALQAVGQEVAFTVPLIAYVVGMIFLLVAPVFQGIGFVEVSMALALERLGVPAPAAIGATLLVRFGELWLPLGIGLLLQAASALPLPSRVPPLRPLPVPVVVRRRSRSS
nr:lysylphosphatidylglycerol synthase domain-containing protein [Chloroflexota bacterium]